MAMPGHKLLVHIIGATGLEHMNHFTGDRPFCACEVKHLDQNVPATKVETQPVISGDTLSPVWDEAWEIEPWYQEEALEFTIYDEGLIGKKTEGSATLPSENIFPTGFSGMLPISGLTNALLQVEVQVLMSGQEQYMVSQPPAYSIGAPASGILSYGAPPPGTLYNYHPSQTYGMPQQGQQTLTYAAPPASMVNVMAPNAMPQQTEAPTPMQETSPPAPEKLAVSILQAHGLQHLNGFTGDHPYVTCEVKNNSKTAVVETKPVTEGDTQNPFWGETHTLEPWIPGEALEFTVYDKGLIGSKTQGKVLMQPELFYPHGFTGMLCISGLPHALLHIIVRPLGASKEAVKLDEGSKKKKKKSSKKKKACC